MIEIKSDYDKETDIVHLEYSSKDSCTLEHLVVVKDIIKRIIDNDITMENVDDVLKIIKKTLFEEIGEREEKKNGKRNNKSKAKV